MEKLQITKDTISLPHFCDESITCNCSFILCDNIGISIATFHFKKDDSFRESEHPDIENARDNAALYVDAHNTYLQHPELPSELFRQNREMKEALLLIRHSPVSNRIIEIVSNCLTSCNKGKE